MARISKPAELETNRQTILDAARRLFARKRVEAITMEDIAAASGYTRRTLYAYFKGADDIRLLILTDDLRVRWALQQQRMNAVETGLGKIAAWAETLYEFSRTNPRVAQLQAYWDYRGIDRKTVGRNSFKAFATINDHLAEGLRSIFRLGVEDGSLRPDLNIDMTISQFLYALRGVIHRGLSPTYSFASFDPDEYVGDFIQLFTRAIAKPKGTCI